MIPLIIPALCVLGLIVASMFLIAPILSLVQILLFTALGCVLFFLVLSSWIILLPVLLFLAFPLALIGFLCIRKGNILLSTIDYSYNISFAMFVISVLLLLIALLNRNMEKKIRLGLAGVSFLIFCGAVSMQNINYKEIRYVRFNQQRRPLKQKLIEKGKQDRYTIEDEDELSDVFRRQKLAMKEALRKLDKENSFSDDESNDYTK